MGVEGPSGAKREATIMDQLKESHGELAEIRTLLGFPPYCPQPSLATATSPGDEGPQPFSLDAVEFLAELLRSDTGDLRRRVAVFKSEFHNQLG